jgi:hypothetical protein
VLDLGSADAFQSSPYSLKSESNIPRNVRRLPPLSGRQLALARACCSITVKRFKDTWICKSHCYDTMYADNMANMRIRLDPGRPPYNHGC